MRKSSKIRTRIKKSAKKTVRRQDKEFEGREWQKRLGKRKTNLKKRYEEDRK